MQRQFVKRLSDLRIEIPVKRLVKWNLTILHFNNYGYKIMFQQTLQIHDIYQEKAEFMRPWELEYRLNEVMSPSATAPVRTQAPENEKG